jgi:hypothetical protein
MIVQYGEISHSSNNHSNHNKRKGAIYNVRRVVEAKSILMQIARAKAANTFH